MSETTTVYLTDQELLHLDGKCEEETQKKIDQAKLRIKEAENFPELPEKASRFLSNLISNIKRSGKLEVSRQSTTWWCDLCGKQPQHPTYKRNTRHALKGEPNTNKPKIPISVMKLNGSRLCNECVKRWQDSFVKHTKDLKAEIPKVWSGEEPKYEKYYKVTCTKCGWKGHEGQMLDGTALMGGGTYKAECPECHAKNFGFGPTLIERNYEDSVVVPV